MGLCLRHADAETLGVLLRSSACDTALDGVVACRVEQPLVLSPLPPDAKLNGLNWSLTGVDVLPGETPVSVEVPGPGELPLIVPRGTTLTLSNMVLTATLEGSSTAAATLDFVGIQLRPGAGLVLDGVQLSLSCDDWSALRHAVCMGDVSGDSQVRACGAGGGATRAKALGPITRASARARPRTRAHTFTLPNTRTGRPKRPHLLESVSRRDRVARRDLAQVTTRLAAVEWPLGAHHGAAWVCMELHGVAWGCCTHIAVRASYSWASLDGRGQHSLTQCSTKGSTHSLYA